jgi:predicted nuclease of restriction endonuclease-like (RecB) superfamily
MAKKKARTTQRRKAKGADRAARGSGGSKAPQSVARPPQNALPAGYAELLEGLKDRIRHAQVRAAVAANRELVRLYWDIGRAIVERQRVEGWGRGVVARLSADLQREFPGVGGFSPQNVWYMRAFYLAWTEEVSILQQPVGDLDSGNPPPLAAELDGENLPQPVGEIPWGHNLQLLSKVKNPLERLWYAHKAFQHGWSRAVLVHQVEMDLYGREGRAPTNFDRTLPAPHSDLAQQTLKDPYILDFLTLAEDAGERELEEGLIEHLQTFLLELGRGFAFVKRQYHLEVGGQDYYLDLLFYHVHLRCFVVIELKVEDFKPEFAGKMNFYLSAVDDQLGQGEHNPSIGIILCKSHNRIIVEYALRDTSKPMGVAAYRLLPKEMKRSLPSPKELTGALRGTAHLSLTATGSLSAAGPKDPNRQSRQTDQDDIDDS